MQLELEGQRDVLTVTELNREARRLLERGLGTVRVEGELSNMSRPASGHLYWSLKDGNAQVRCAMFRQANRRLGFRPEDGQHVVLRGRVSIYEARGDYQLIVEDMEEAGVGALRRRFEELKRKLAAEGLFDADRKRPLPGLPARIGVVTSPTGAAIRDVLIALRRRFPATSVLIYPTSVQGAQAAEEIVRALARAGKRAECDVLILTRGGGSLEDLWPFNEEIVARAIAQVSLPIIVGVGHEIDFTIADFVADVRAPTPSQAAELAVPVQLEIEQQLALFADRLGRLVLRELEGRREKLAVLEHRLSRTHPQIAMQARQQRLDDLEARMLRAMRQQRLDAGRSLASLSERVQRAHPGHRIGAARDRIAAHRRRIEELVRRRLERLGSRISLAERGLKALSPLATLERGFAIVTRQADGVVVTRPSGAPAGTDVDIRLAEGAIRARVMRKSGQ